MNTINLFLLFLMISNVNSKLPLNSEKDRSLWINPDIKPTSNVGFNIILNITCSGKYTTVQNIYLRSGIEKLGYPINPSRFAFAGNAAIAGWKSVTTFVINLPTVHNREDAIKKISNINANSLKIYSGVKTILSTNYKTVKLS